MGGLRDVPNGYDLDRPGAWPFALPRAAEHILYESFLERAEALGYDTKSLGFKESEDAYFGFFLAGVDAEAGPAPR